MATYLGSRRITAAFVAVCAAAALAGAAPAGAQQKVKIGALKLTSSAPLFIGVEKGFFKEFGIEPELVFFQAAAPIATALATGQVDVGATGVTAALYNIVLGGEQMWIVADKGREWPGYPLTGIVVQKELYDGGLRGIADLRSKRIGITTLGSTFHYHLGNVLEKAGLTLADVRVVPLQTMPAAIEALRGKQVDAILLPQPFPGMAESQGFGKILFWAGDLYPWQVATVFYSKKFAADRKRAVDFMKGYVKASRPAPTTMKSSASRRSTRRRGPRSFASAFPSRTGTAACSSPTSTDRCSGGRRTDS